MLKLLQVLVVMGCLFGLSQGYAAEAPGSAAAQVEVPAEGKDAESKGWSGFTIFLLVFVFALLFVISSATAMNALGGKGRAPRNRDEATPKRKKSTESKLPEGQDRFRL